MTRRWAASFRFHPRLDFAERLVMQALRLRDAEGPVYAPSEQISKTQKAGSMHCARECRSIEKLIARVASLARFVPPPPW